MLYEITNTWSKTQKDGYIKPMMTYSADVKAGMSLELRHKKTDPPSRTERQGPKWRYMNNDQWPRHSKKDNIENIRMEPINKH